MFFLKHGVEMELRGGGRGVNSERSRKAETKLVCLKRE